MGLTRRKPDNTWTDWNSSWWECDAETADGYTKIDDTEFFVQHEPDTFAEAPPCDKFDGPGT